MPQRMIAIIGCLVLGSGCAAMHPLRGVPAAYMPHEYQAVSREGKSTINLSLLQRTQPDQYRMAAGDVLTVYAPGLLGLVDTQPDQPRGENPPINLPQNSVDRPSVGFPVPVRDDHTIQIPQLPAMDVYGLTEREIEDRLKDAVLRAGLLANDTQPRIVVSLMRPRTYRVLVCRQETNSTTNSMAMVGSIDIGRAGKGTSRVVDLRAGENDVAHALAQPGVDGLPGLDARNVIYVLRARNSRGHERYSTRHESMPTPVSQSRPRDRSSRMLVRGQSPDSRYGGMSSSGKGPYGYLEASQFNLSGRDIAQGANGPALIEPIPGMMVPNHPTGAGTSQTSGYGHSVPSRPEFRDPTRSTRAYVAPQMQPVADRHSLPMNPGVRGESPYQTVQYNQPVQYPAPQAQLQQQSLPSYPQPQYQQPQLPQAQPWSSPHMGQSEPAMSSPVQARYPTSTSVNSYSPIGGGGMMTPGRGMDNPSVVVDSSTGFDGSGMSAPVAMMTPDHAPAWRSTLRGFDPTIESDEVIKIPVRLQPGETLDLTEEDVTLYDGDIVFIESRDTDVYFIGGLLGGGQYPLPRDRDLHVLEAVSLAQGRGMTQSGIQSLQSSGGVSALNRDVIPSASRLIILRKVGCEQVVTIEVDLYKALRFPHENILVQPEDMLILQYTPCEAFGAFLQRNVLEGALLGIAAGSFQSGN